MKKRSLKLVSLATAAVIMTSLMIGCQSNGKPADNIQTANTQSDSKATTTAETAKQEPVTIKVLHAWNGGCHNLPTDQVNNPIAKAIREKTGVTADVIAVTSSESERLNTAFMAGEEIDLINAPYWSSQCLEGVVLVKAGREDMLTDLTGKYEKYPNLKRAMETGVAADFMEYDIDHKDFKGKKYLIPQQTPRTKEDLKNYADNLWVRGDILKELGIKASDIHTSDDIYNLLKKIKAGNFKDVNGKPIVPGGAWGNNGGAFMFTMGFQENNTFCTDYWNINGKVIDKLFSDNEIKQCLFMRKLVNEGLYDREAFNHNDSVAKEKAAIGKVGVIGGHYFQMRDFFDKTLYVKNPEMKYVPVGPLYNANGKPVCRIEFDGRSGFPVMCIPAISKKADAVLRYLDYIDSDEGINLVRYGIDGVHSKVVNGIPEFTPEWQEIKDKNVQKFNDEGLAFYENFQSAFPGSKYDPDRNDKDWQAAKELFPQKFITGFRASYIARSYPNYQEVMKPQWDINYTKEYNEKAIFAASDEEAIKILNQFRDKIKATEIPKIWQYVEDEAKKRNDVVW